MNISLKTHKKLWGLAAQRCAFEECKKELAVDTFETDDYYNIGDEAHIISKKINGPRFTKDFPIEQIDKYDNLILLCKEHHVRIDKDVKFYTKDKIRAIKEEHEKWVRDTLKIDAKQLKDDELFADYIDYIEFLGSFNEWTEWTEYLLGGHYTKIEKQQFKNLIELHRFLSGRVYPKSRNTLVKAIKQFNLVLEDLINEFDEYKTAEEYDKKYYVTEQFYRTGIITAEKQDIHEYTIESLVFELTKAGNYLCDQIRENIFPTYRIKEGILLLKDAPIMGIAYRRFEYKKNEKYVGLNKIVQLVKKRVGH